MTAVLPLLAAAAGESALTLVALRFLARRRAKPEPPPAADTTTVEQRWGVNAGATLMQRWPCQDMRVIPATLACRLAAVVGVILDCYRNGTIRRLKANWS